MSVPCLLGLLLAAAAPLSAPGPLKNGGFESAVAARPDAGHRVSGWTVPAPGLIPSGWTLNPAYPGELTLQGPPAPAPLSGPAHGGQQFVRITARERHAHLYQICEGLDPAQWYRVSAWIRGGPVSLSFYEYFTASKIGNQGVIQSTIFPPEWKRVEGFYRPTAAGYLRSALAISVPPGKMAEIDDVSIEALDLPAVGPDAGIVLETDAIRVALSSQGLLRELRSKASGQNYAVEGPPLPVLEATVQGMTVPLHSLTREGDLIHARFLDPEVRATLRVTPRQHHIRFEVKDVQPARRVDKLTLRFPVRRLSETGAAFNATYDEQFGVCLLGVTETTYQQLSPCGTGVISLEAHCTQSHGMAGASFALTAAARNQFETALMETERQNGLPCPLLDGQWARISEPVRRSYLFMVDAQESQIDRIIEYAKLGHFGTIIFLKDNWLETHGHFRINKKNFPDGIASLQRSVSKIHAAGMKAGVHVFGPSISPNDPYITPRPDDRLAYVDCPPLASPVDVKATVLPLTGEPPLPPKEPRNDAFPGFHIRIGDEIIRYQQLELSPSPRFTGCQRGALGTQAASHEKGAPVKGLLSMWSYFLVNPDSTLAGEVTTNFATVFNACDFDMAYFDASDGISDAYLDRWYYLNKLHLGYYRKFKKDVLYQTSNGTGSNLLWHIVPRSASADGHGDLKNYLDERLPGMRAMATNFTRPDVGWYYMFAEVRPDQIEYVCAKTMGLDGSISIETSLATMDQHARARQMIEMVGRYELCRLARSFPAGIREQLCQPGKDFKLFGGPGNWQLHRAVYEEPRYVEALDGAQNVWTIRNDLPVPCTLGVEIARGSRNVPTSAYDQAGAVTVERFDAAESFRWEDESRAKRYFPGNDVTRTGAGAVKPGVSMHLETATRSTRSGPGCVVLSAVNTGPRGGWCAVAKTLSKPADLRHCEGLALWIDGDAKGENLKLQLHDSAGHSAVFTVPVSFSGWRLCVFRTASATGFDWSKTDHLLVWLQGLAGNMAVRVRLDDLRGLPKLPPAPVLMHPSLQVNGQLVTFPVQLEPQQALTAEGTGGIRLWPGGMQPGQALKIPAAPLLLLQPGENRILFSAGAAGGGYPGDVNVLLYRMWPLQNP